MTQETTRSIPQFHIHNDGCYTRIPDTEGTGEYLSCRLVSGMPENPAHRTLCQVMDEMRKPLAHTYASENADRYRGFDEGQLSAAKTLQPIVDELRALTEKWDMEAIELNNQGEPELAENTNRSSLELAAIVGHPGEDEGR